MHVIACNLVYALEKRRANKVLLLKYEYRKYMCQRRVTIKPTNVYVQLLISDIITLTSLAFFPKAFTDKPDMHETMVKHHFKIEYPSYLCRICNQTKQSTFTLVSISLYRFWLG